ncbi:MAG TPA: putative sulfate exporter family transporter [Bosea sp. (in: a-proteobacteria)]|jgi:uncharacterized integral membrane protein (TIGR00698 family)|nr:putative sulfate exporter family transporter [Bosea sp. (in: a-proteobacteria)]
MTPRDIDSAENSRFAAALAKSRAVLPGLVLCLALTVFAMALEALERGVFGHVWLDALVIAILVGTIVRSVWSPSALWRTGIVFSARTLLETAVVLMGASLGLDTLIAVGPGLLGGIAGVVAIALAASYGIARALRLKVRLAILIACGNSICGNSAIAAVAPVIRADSNDVASAIAFTAVLGVLVVLLLPVLIPALGLSAAQYGILSGLTVYAVPQVVAAAAPGGIAAVHLGTLVKLVRVLMLGPVILVLSILARRMRTTGDDGNSHIHGGDRPMPPPVPVNQLVPWFIVAFFVMAALRSAGLFPTAALRPIAVVADVMTVGSMAALGLGVDIRTVARAGSRITAAVTLSLIALIVISYGLIRLLGIA